jgi:branched-chain amino acid transport system permease protein
MEFRVLLQLIASGIGNGSLYALMALGMTILLRTTTLINFSYGEFAMAAAYFVYVGIEILGWSYALSVFLAFGLLFLLGLAVERGLIRPLSSAPPLTLAVLIIAVSFLLKGVARFFFGRDYMRLPALVEGDPVEVAGVVFFPQDLLVIGGSMLTVILFFVLLEGTRIGKVIQATSQTPKGAALVGINVPRFHSMMWASVAVIGGLAGILIAPVTLLYPDMGSKILIKGLAAMTFGGFGSLAGAVLGGFLLGILENLAGGYVASALTDVTAYLVIILVLLIRPRGLLGEWKPSHV